MHISQLFIKLRKRLSWSYAGQFRSMLKGAGVELVDTRKYVAGDAKKFVNWKQSAKHNDLYVSLFAQEKDVQVDLFCDVNYNRSSRFVQDILWDMLADLVVTGLVDGMRLMVYTLADNWRVWSIRQWSDWYVAQADLWLLIDEQGSEYHSWLSAFLHRMGHHTKKRVICVVSDFLALSDLEVQRLLALAVDHHLVLLRVRVDPHEGVNYIGGVRDMDPRLASYVLEIHS